jgi:serine-type D-Ala-D-Ala carboxypeptidase/endopeptidase (penicillin-binding protein 4)
LGERLKQRIHWGSGLFAFLLILLISCQGVPPKKVAEVEITDANIGYVVVDLDSQKILATQNETQPFLTASLAKIPTTLAALKILGPEYRFRTRLVTSGLIRKGTLAAPLTLVGGGDPLLLASHLMELVDCLRARGLKEVKGKFYYDDSYLGKGESLDSVVDVDSADNPGLSALSLNFNRWEWRTRSIEGKMTVYAIPDLALLKPELTEPGKERPKFHRKAWNEENWELKTGHLGHQPGVLPVKNPSLFTAQFLVKLMRMAGISVGDPIPAVRPVPANAHELARHESEPLISLVERVLEFSNNAMAELLTLSTARALSGKALSPEASVRRVSQWIEAQLPGQGWETYAGNASGLNSRGLVTPNQLTQMLAWADPQNFLGRSFLSLLPVSGWKGTLKGRLYSPETAFRVWAKTGTVFYGGGLAGYLFTRGGKRLAFTVLIYDLAQRELVNQMTPDELIEDSREEAWLSLSRRLQDRLVEKWIGQY